MPILAFPKEVTARDYRCALLPINVKAYKQMGLDIHIESGLGTNIHVSDHEYSEAGATVTKDRQSLLKSADIVMTMHPLPALELPTLPNKQVMLISFLDPFNEYDYIQQLNTQAVTSVSMEMVPRISRCQKMDALSSQASLAGYVMAMEAANALQSVLPMMMTPAGTLKPAKVFVIGAGVAGLQAIATAKRLGANVTAFDTRSVVAEQVQSLGAKFLDIDLGETGESAQGYAQQLTPEQLAKQQQEQAKCIADSDIVITTAQLFGRKPPLLIKKDVLNSMRPGSVVVDMAAESGGNVEGSESGQTVMIDGVTVIGTGAWANGVAKHATQMYANNLQHLLGEFWDEEKNQLAINLDDEVQGACVITHAGDTVNKTISEIHQKISQNQQNEGA
jgi:NAD(P) transhydrogenase subunit alpha